MIRAPLTSGKKRLISLDRVAIDEVEVRGVLFGGQDFVRRPHFTQPNFSSDSIAAMLTESAAVCDTITTSAVCSPWNPAGTTSSCQVISDLCG